MNKNSDEQGKKKDKVTLHGKPGDVPEKMNSN